MRLSIVLFLIFFAALPAFAQSNKKSKLMAENFAATTLNGKTVSLTDFKGKVVLIAFWTTRCPICAAEIPNLNKLAENYQDKNIVFLGLTTDSEDKVKEHLKRKPFDFTILPNSFGILLKYAERDREGNVMMGFPAYFLINQKGEIELKAMGFDKINLLETQIKRLLN